MYLHYWPKTATIYINAWFLLITSLVSLWIMGILILTSKNKHGIVLINPLPQNDTFLMKLNEFRSNFGSTKVNKFVPISTSKGTVPFN